MKTYVFLIILGFIHIVFCNQDLNFTQNDQYSVCPVEFFRRKRAHAEYTRWRANLETTPEFIVKVLDEDITTSNIKPIYAVNIQPLTRPDEKIIIGGAMVPPQTTTRLTTEVLRDYTRFVPPTTGSVTPMQGDTYQPHKILSNVINAIPGQLPGPIPDRGSYGMDRNSQRDDSPPAGPQFIARTPVLLARQYAPISPVAFTRIFTLAPLTPSPASLYSVRKIISPPTRTSPLPDVLQPIRTTSDIEDFQKFQGYGEDTIHPEPMFVTRSTIDDQQVPERSSLMEFEPTTEKEDSLSFLNRFIDDSRKKEEEKLKVSEKETDSSYNVMFYNEDNELGDKKEAQDDFDKNRMNEDFKDDIKYRAHDSNPPDSIEESESENTTLTNEIESDDDNRVDDEAENVSNVTRKGVHLPDVEIATFRSATNKTRDKRRPVCNLLKLRQLNFNSPRTLPEIISQLKQWAEDSPLAKWVDITDGNFTTMENPIYMMIVDDLSSGQIVTAKQTVMIVAGIQGRDHHAVTAAMYVLYQLIERSEAHADLLSKYRFWIIPVFNPDGYDYSTTFPHRREWAKNLHQTWDTCKGRESCRACEMYGIRCTVQSCHGVNLDRNFEYQWIPELQPMLMLVAEELRAEHPCGPLYAGERQLSESETSALTHFLHELRMSLFTFIAFKEGDVLGIMYPYSHTKKKRAFDHVYRQRASRAASAAYSISGRPYVAGQTSEFLPLYAGGIEDWIDGHLGIDNTYTIMMFRPTDSYNTKLITERVVHEAYAAMDTLLLQSLEPLGPPLHTMTRSGGGLIQHASFLLILANAIPIFTIQCRHC